MKLLTLKNFILPTLAGIALATLPTTAYAADPFPAGTNFTANANTTTVKVRETVTVTYLQSCDTNATGQVHLSDEVQGPNGPLSNQPLNVAYTSDGRTATATATYELPVKGTYTFKAYGTLCAKGNDSLGGSWYSTPVTVKASDEPATVTLAPIPEFTSNQNIGEYTVDYNSSGLNLSSGATWTITGNLPAGLSWKGAGQNLIFSGTPTIPGQTSLQATLTDGEGNSATAPLSFTVNPAVTPSGEPANTPAAPTAATEGVTGTKNTNSSTPSPTASADTSTTESKPDQNLVIGGLVLVTLLSVGAFTAGTFKNDSEG